MDASPRAFFHTMIKSISLKRDWQMDCPLSELPLQRDEPVGGVEWKSSGANLRNSLKRHFTNHKKTPNP